MVLLLTQKHNSGRSKNIFQGNKNLEWSKDKPVVFTNCNCCTIGLHF